MSPTPGGGGHAVDFFVMSRSMDIREVFDQQRNVLRPLRECRQSQANDLEPVIKVFAKLARRHGILLGCDWWPREFAHRPVSIRWSRRG